MKIKHVALRTFDGFRGRTPTAGSHLVIVVEDPDDPSNDILLERFSDDPPGEFNEVPIVILPSKP